MNFPKINKKKIIRKVEGYIRSSLRFFFKLTKVKFIYLDEHPFQRQAVLYMPNHVSSLDVLFLYAFLPKGTYFALTKHEMKRKSVRWLMRFAPVVSFNYHSPADAKKLMDILGKNHSCVLFVEGKITVTGNLMKIYEAHGILADRANVPLVPVWINGPQHGFFSRVKKKMYSRFLPKTTISIQHPITFKMGEKGKKDRNFISNELYRMMLNISFQATYNPDTSFFYELVQTAKINAKKEFFFRPKVVFDPMHEQGFSYKDILVLSFVYGMQIKKQVPMQEHVGILLANSIDNLACFIGCLAYDRVAAMLNFSAGFQSVSHCINLAGIKTVVTSRLFIENYPEWPEKMKQNGVSLLYIEDMQKSLYYRLKAWCAYKAKYVPYRYSGLKKAVVLFTSGSESLPKAVVLSHQNITANIHQFASLIDINRTDVLFNALPMFHSFGLVTGTLYPLLCGGRLYLYPTPLHYRQIPEIIYRIGATMMFGTDTFLKNYAKVAHPFDMHTLRFVLGGAEMIQASTRNLWMERFGVRLFEGYGATECSPVVTVNNRIFCHFGSVGQFLPAIRFKLRKVDGISKGGELCVKGPNIMMGYISSEDCHKIIPLEDGWYATGDIVEIDDLGFVFIKGRLRMFAKIGGEMVSLSLVENIAREVNPKGEYAAVSVAHETKGEQIVLVATIKGFSLTQMNDFIKKGEYSELLLPRVVLYKDKIPLLPSGKRDNTALRAWVVEKIKKA